jgi:hypothetical protein
MYFQKEAKRRLGNVGWVDQIAQHKIRTTLNWAMPRKYGRYLAGADFLSAKAIESEGQAWNLYCLAHE